jgi:hypothetical protein
MLVKHNNNSISSITTPGSLAQGKMTLISSQTASGSASIEFTSGIDSTYPIYKFEFINIHPATDVAEFVFNLSTDGGSNYNVTKTSTSFGAYHREADNSAGLEYDTSNDLAQSTSDKYIATNVSSDNDSGCSGFLKLFSPSSTTFVKHFIGSSSRFDSNPDMYHNNFAGYGNTTSSINAIIFRMNSGNIDSGTIKLYGIKGD